MHVIDGVYALVPYISGAYGWSEAERHRGRPDRTPSAPISVNEVDPLRDESLALYRELLAAGVDAWSGK